jgi:hypothetical protein
MCRDDGEQLILPARVTFAYPAHRRTAMSGIFGLPFLRETCMSRSGDS